MSDRRASVQSRRKFPVWRIFIAMVVVSVFPPFLLFALAMRYDRPDLSGLALLPLASIMYAWPGALTFLLFGLPTLYLLLRANRTSFLLFAFFGAAYTSLPWAILQEIKHPPYLKFLSMIPTFGMIGIANGIFTRLIVVGFRSKPAAREGDGSSRPDDR